METKIPGASGRPGSVSHSDPNNSKRVMGSSLYFRNSFPMRQLSGFARCEGFGSARVQGSINVDPLAAGTLAALSVVMPSNPNDVLGFVDKAVLSAPPMRVSG